jgi:hypothetical protein
MYEPYVAWLHEQPCVVCGTRQNIQGSHVGVGGMGLKHGSAADMVPMCGPRSTPGLYWMTIMQGCHAQWEQYLQSRDDRINLARHWRLGAWRAFFSYISSLPVVMPEERACAEAIGMRMRELETP